jgi:hypothetical protein
VNREFQLGARIGLNTGPIAFADDDLLPATAAGVLGGEELWREALSPLHIELVTLAELH